MQMSFYTLALAFVCAAVIAMPAPASSSIDQDLAGQFDSAVSLTDARQTNDEIDRECTICYTELGNNAAETTSICGNHQFHRQCIEQWRRLSFSQNAYSCPMCRQFGPQQPQEVAPIQQQYQEAAPINQQPPMNFAIGVHRGYASQQLRRDSRAENAGEPAAQRHAPRQQPSTQSNVATITVNGVTSHVHLDPQRSHAGVVIHLLFDEHNSDGRPQISYGTDGRWN